MHSSTLFDLSSFHCLKVTGENAQTFLQGQLTCDVRLLTPTHGIRGMLCNIKGRVLALVEVVLFDNEITLIYPSNLHHVVYKNLDMPARLSRVTLEIDPKVYCYGLFHPESTKPDSNDQGFETALSRLLSPNGSVGQAVTLFPNYALMISHEKDLAAQTSLPLAPLAEWHTHLLKHQLMFIYPETSGQFLPQRLNLDQFNYISYDKGCYKGQEIIARMHYRGVNKYQLITKQIHSATPLFPGMSVYTPHSQQPIGELIDCEMIQPGEYLILASVLENEGGSSSFQPSFHKNQHTGDQ